MTTTTLYTTDGSLSGTVGSLLERIDPYKDLTIEVRVEAVLNYFLNTNTRVMADYNSGGYLNYGFLSDGRFKIDLDQYEIWYSGILSTSGSTVTSVDILDRSGTYLNYSGSINYFGLPLFTSLKNNSSLSLLGSVEPSGEVATLFMNASVSQQLGIQGQISAMAYQFIDPSGVVVRDFTGGGNLQFNNFSGSMNVFSGYFTQSSLDTRRYPIDDPEAYLDYITVEDAFIPISATSSNLDVFSGDDVFTLTGTLGSSVYTSSGNDLVRGGIGNDTIDGGSGFDTVEIASLFADVLGVAYANDGSGVVITSNQGRDSMVNVELVRFLDAEYTPAQLMSLLPISQEFSISIGGVSSGVSPTLFNGPASLNLQYQLIDTTPNAIIAGSNLNDFIVLQGGGNKAVNGGLGNDVIDGGTGSTFVSGGGGSNTFFLDGRASGISWSTITDFQLGADKATIWGWKQGVSRVKAVETDGGAAGYSGLTLHFENLLPDGSPSGSLNANLNSITFSNLNLSTFGASSVAELNQQISSGSNSHFVVGQTNDVYGEHGFLFIS